MAAFAATAAVGEQPFWWPRIEGDAPTSSLIDRYL